MLESPNLLFEDVLPQLAGLYRQGLLVPFLGAGMSRNVCCGWEQLLKNMAAQMGISIQGESSEKILTPPEIIRIADEITSLLRPYDIEAQIKIYQNALLAEPNQKAIPSQIEALAELHWPLTITTNYDDLFWSARYLNELQRQKNDNNKGTAKDKIEILGRSVEDCHSILHSLDSISSPKIWALQGFIGGQLTNPATIFDNVKKRVELARQIVLGHQQYQRAINTALHFRRAFAEVFRRRSLLFLGSGILEDYLVNLFSEILHNQGCGPYPHFALLKNSEKGKYDNLFMQQRLGIVPIFYEDHSELPHLLKKFSSLIKYWLDKSDFNNEPVAPFIFQDEIGFSLTAKSTNGVVPVKVNCCKSVLPLPDDNVKECSAVSVGRFKNLLSGSQAESHISAYHKKVEHSEIKTWIMVDEAPSYVFRYGDSSIFAIAARSKDLQTHFHDTRDLGIIPDAVFAFLKEADKAEFETIHIGPVAAGRNKPWHPIHPFAQSLQGVRKFLNAGLLMHIKRINMYVIDPATWAGIVSRKIQLETLLTSGVSTHYIETTDANGIVESFSITLKELPKLKELLKICKIDRRYWNVELSPFPIDKNEEISDEMIITSTMKVLLSARQ